MKIKNIIKGCLILFITINNLSKSSYAIGDYWEDIEYGAFENRVSFSTSVLNNAIYVVGGLYLDLESSEINTSNATQTFNPKTNVWETKSNTLTARWGLTTSVVNNKLYAIGGANEDYEALNTIEMYDPATDTWTPKASMSTGRFMATSSVVGNKIYVIGETDGSKAIEIYDPEEDVWESKIISIKCGKVASSVVNNKIYIAGEIDDKYSIAVYDPETDILEVKQDMLTDRAVSKSIALGDKIYLFGDRNNTYSKVVEVYDVETNALETKALIDDNSSYDYGFDIIDDKIYAFVVYLPVRGYTVGMHIYYPMTDVWEYNAFGNSTRVFSTSSVIGNELYIIGGMHDIYSDITNKVLAYNPKSNTWTIKASMLTKRDGATSGVIDNKIYVMGGSDENGEALNTVEMYDPTTDTWTTKASMLTKRAGATSGVIDNKIYVIGGIDENGEALNTIEMYDPTTDTWTTKAGMLTKRCEVVVSGVVDNKIYVIGGIDENGEALNIVEMYDPTTDTCTTKASMLTKRAVATSGVIDNKIYVIGGLAENGEALNTVEMYDPATDTWTTKASMLTKRAVATSGVIDNKIYVFGGLAEMTEYSIKMSSSLSIYTPDYVPETLERKKVSANLDIYIKSENMLLMSLSTNQITFEDFSGVSDMLKDDAVEISVNSSLPYNLNAYLATEIQNSNKSNTMEKEILQLKEDSEIDYQYFENINEKMTLKNNCDAGNDKTHLIDFKLKGGIAHEKDIYKAVIKFEVEQI